MTRIRVSGLSFFFIALVFFAVRLEAQTLSVTSPLDYQVFQRQTREMGAIVIRGHAEAGVKSVRVSVKGQSILGQFSRSWSDILPGPDGEFHARLDVSAGGFYSVEVQARRGHRVAGSVAIPHVGVGEVFLISGQSNSTNYGEVLQTTQTRMVTTFSGESWRIADDPQPGTQDDSKKGSFVPSFGDALYRKYKVPIGIASVGHGSTSVRQWLPAGESIKVMPTMTKYVSRDADGALVSDGTLFDGMMQRMQQLGPHGFRAVLWHQGESDSHQPVEHEISAAEYRSMLEHIILSAREQAGWEMPWFVAQVSYHNPDDPSNPAIRDAQKSLWTSKVALQGPDTDTLTAAYRQNNGKGTHFNAAGLKAHGLLWAEAVETWLDGMLQ
jgi:hypothetical protein